MFRKLTKTIRNKNSRDFRNIHNHSDNNQLPPHQIRPKLWRRLQQHYDDVLIRNCNRNSCYSPYNWSWNWWKLNVGEIWFRIRSVTDRPCCKRHQDIVNIPLKAILPVVNHWWPKWFHLVRPGLHEQLAQSMMLLLWKSFGIHIKLMFTMISLQLTFFLNRYYILCGPLWPIKWCHIVKRKDIICLKLEKSDF